MLTESLQELVSLLLLYNYHEGLLVSGTILNFIFLSLVFIPFPAQLSTKPNVPYLFSFCFLVSLSFVLNVLLHNVYPEYE